MKKTKSPCIGACKINYQVGRCLGCNRTLKEIEKLGKEYLKKSERQNTGKE